MYHHDDPDNPVAWVLQYPIGRLGGLYTLKEYRQKGFGVLLTEALSKSVAANGLIPETLTEIRNKVSRKVPQKLGFIMSNYNSQWLVLKT